MIAVVCPSRDRPEELKGLIKSVMDTSTDAVVMSYIDHDQARLYEEVEESDRNGMVVGPRIGPVAAFNALAKESGADVVCAATDDSRFLTPGWDRWVQKTVDGFPNRVGAISPYLTGIDYVSFPCVTKGWMDAVGWFAYPRAFHFCWDTVVEMIAEPTGLVYAKEHEFAMSHPNHTSSNIKAYFERDARGFLYWAIGERRQAIRRVLDARAR